MAKNKNERYEEKENSVEEQEMTASEAKAFRMSLNKAQVKEMSDQDKREAFRVYWAQEKSKYGKSKDLESVLWLHLKSMKMDSPEKFEDGLKHFGLQKLGN